MEVAELAQILTERGQTVSVAEACTCGLIGYMLGTVPGSSRYFPGGVVAYTGGLKEKILGVPDDYYTTYGSVSEEMAIAMARGVRELTGTDYAVSTTGVTGPAGGRSGLPIGTFWVGPVGEGRRGLGHRNPRGRRPGYYQTRRGAGRPGPAGPPFAGKLEGPPRPAPDGGWPHPVIVRGGSAMTSRNQSVQLISAVEQVIEVYGLDVFEQYWELYKEIGGISNVQRFYVRTGASAADAADVSFCHAAIIGDGLLVDIQGDDCLKSGGLRFNSLASIVQVSIHDGPVDGAPSSEGASLVVVASRPNDAGPGLHWVAKTEQEENHLLPFAKTLARALGRR